MAKKRLDLLVSEGGYAPSRERAKALIMEGRVFVNGQREDKPGTAFDPASVKTFEVKGGELPYVSRGGFKLEKAFNIWDIDVNGRICMDVGASTGGFTDVMLQNGAAKVYAVDSGTNQLAWKLRSDERVICMEKTNFRYVTEADIPEKIGFTAIDASFISLEKLLPPAALLMEEGAELVCLIKPQFEAGKDRVGKHGVVRDRAVHREVIENVRGYACDADFEVVDISFSPIKGPEGNIEYLMRLRKRESASPDDRGNTAEADSIETDNTETDNSESGAEGTQVQGTTVTEEYIARIVDEAHRELDTAN